MIQILFAVLAGILTIGAPCILPILPILLGNSVGQSSKTRPLFIVLGFVITFSVVGLLLSFLTTHLGIQPNTLRIIAIIMLSIFAVFMIWPTPFELMTEKINGFINKANQVGQSGGTGNFGGFLLGVTLGVVWTPCAGPILGAILTLIATQGSSARSAILLIAYALGAGIPMLVIAYGSQYVTTKVRAISKYTRTIQQVFGFIILLLAFAMYKQYDLVVQAKLAAIFPTSNIERNLTSGIKDSNQTPVSQNDNTSPMKKIEFKNYGPAPEFTDINNWLNSSPLTMQELKGKVVLIDFWTYSCINCIRTLPYVTKWYDTYKDKSFIVIGVHTPEFAFEKVSDNVKTAMGRFNINYPVAQDNDYGTWNAYKNQYWPAEYLIDKNGQIVYEHFGEGNYDHTENAIRQLLGLGADKNAQTSSLGNINSPEMYFGTARQEYLNNSQRGQLVSDNTTIDQVKTYSLPKTLSLNTFALSGDWKFSADKATLIKGPGIIKLHFSSGKVFMVAESQGKPIILHIAVDGKGQSDVAVSSSQLYTLFDSTQYSEHIMEITIPDGGLDAFTFTFG